jgi:hypothetical protein
MKVTAGLLELLRHICNIPDLKLSRRQAILVEIILSSSSLLPDIFWDRVCSLLEHATTASLHVLSNSSFTFSTSFKAAALLQRPTMQLERRF